MAVPKKKTSKSRRGMRRAHWQATAPETTKCPKCGEPKMPHRACPGCGYYRDNKVLATEE